MLARSDQSSLTRSASLDRAFSLTQGALIHSLAQPCEHQTQSDLAQWMSSDEQAAAGLMYRYPQHSSSRTLPCSCALMGHLRTATVIRSRTAQLKGAGIEQACFCSTGCGCSVAGTTAAAEECFTQRKLASAVACLTGSVWLHSRRVSPQAERSAAQLLQGAVSRTWF